VSRILLFFLRAYQYLLSPLVGNQCRFAPTCSQFAREAIERYGPLRGSWMAMGRLARCHPWHEGGVHPVPAEFRWGCVCAQHGRARMRAKR
jgi:hypothetical protein